MDLNKRRYVNYVKALAVAFGLILFDQLTKLTAVENLKGQNPFVIIDGVFQLEYLENRGAAFGIFQGKQIIFYPECVSDQRRGDLVLFPRAHGASLSSSSGMWGSGLCRSLGKLY